MDHDHEAEQPDVDLSADTIWGDSQPRFVGVHRRAHDCVKSDDPEIVVLSALTVRGLVTVFERQFSDQRYKVEDAATARDLAVILDELKLVRLKLYFDCDQEAG